MAIPESRNTAANVNISVLPPPLDNATIKGFYQSNHRNASYRFHSQTQQNYLVSRTLGGGTK